MTWRECLYEVNEEQNTVGMSPNRVPIRMEKKQMRALEKFVVVKKNDGARTTQGGIIIPDPKVSNEATVRSIGPGVELGALKIDDVVVLINGAKITLTKSDEGEELFIVPYEDIGAVK